MTMFLSIYYIVCVCDTDNGCVYKETHKHFGSWFLKCIYMVLGNFTGTWEGQEFEIEWIKIEKRKTKKGFYKKGWKCTRKFPFGSKDIYNL